MLMGLAIGSTPATAGVIAFQSFDENPPLAIADGPGVWSIDRFAPAVFESQDFMGDNRLVLGIDGNDLQSSPFQNTQGRKFLTPGAQSMSIDFFLDPEFADVDGRIGGFWSTATDNEGNITFFPIIEFFNGQFQVFDSLQSSGSAVFLPVGSPGDFGIDFGDFVNLSFSLSGSDIAFLINGALALKLGAGGTEQFANVILQGVNLGVDRTLVFDNFQAIPVPAPVGLLGLGLLGLGFAARRRRGA